RASSDLDVDAVGLVADVLVEPGELDLELLGAEADGAEHADPARLGHRGDDVAAVAEGEDRELDAQLVADRGAHGGASLVGCRSVRSGRGRRRPRWPRPPGRRARPAPRPPAGAPAGTGRAAGR